MNLDNVYRAMSNAGKAEMRLIAVEQVRNHAKHIEDENIMRVLYSASQLTSAAAFLKRAAQMEIRARNLKAELEAERLPKAR